jgi:NAD(P)-dependent dehydrogenase (short-subunit alcohol dehydrogenase family)
MSDIGMYLTKIGSWIERLTIFRPDFINAVKLPVAVPYAISKAGLNTLIAKFHASYHTHGILFMSICPGCVDTAEGKQYKYSDYLLTVELYT